METHLTNLWFKSKLAVQWSFCYGNMTLGINSLSLQHFTSICKIQTQSHNKDKETATMETAYEMLKQAVVADYP